MEKPIIATTLSGLFVKHEPWKKAHVLWYEDAAEKLKDRSILEWIERPNYFKGVDEVMQRLYPDLSDEERTRRARETFFDSVLEYIKRNPNVKNQDIVDCFTSLKKRFRIGLITTNTRRAINRILPLVGLEGFFDIIKTSKPEEKDDKRIVFDRFIRGYGKPILYIGGSRRDSYDYCKEYGIREIFANLECEENIGGVTCVHDLDELKKEILDVF